MKIIKNTAVFASVFAMASLLMASGGCSSDSSGGSRLANIRQFCEKGKAAGCDDSEGKTVDDCVAEVSKDMEAPEACEQKVDAFVECIASNYSPSCEEDSSGHTITIDPNVQKVCKADYDAVGKCYAEHQGGSGVSGSGGSGG